MKKIKFSFDGVLYIVGIIGAASALIEAIFEKDHDKEVDDELEDMKKRIDYLEKNRGRF